MIRLVFFFQAEDGIRDDLVTGVQTCALPISSRGPATPWHALRWLPCSSDAGGLARCAPERRLDLRSEERRVGKEGRSRWSPNHLKKKTEHKRHIHIT